MRKALYFFLLGALALAIACVAHQRTRVPAPGPGVDGVIVKDSTGIHVYHRRHKTTHWEGMTFKDVIK